MEPFIPAAGSFHEIRIAAIRPKRERNGKRQEEKQEKGEKMDSRRIVRGIFEIYHSAGSVNFAESIKRPDELIKNFPGTNLLWDHNPLNWRSFI